MISRIAIAFLALPALAAGFTPSFVPALGGRVALRAAATSAMSSARVSCPDTFTGLLCLGARLGRTSDFFTVCCALAAGRGRNSYAGGA